MSRITFPTPVGQRASYIGHVPGPRILETLSKTLSENFVETGHFQRNFDKVFRQRSTTKLGTSLLGQALHRSQWILKNGHFRLEESTRPDMLRREFCYSTPSLQIKSGHLTMPANPNNQTLPPFRQRDWRAGLGGETRPRLLRTTLLRRVEFQNCSIFFLLCGRLILRNGKDIFSHR